MPRGRPPGSKNKKTLEKESLFSTPVVEEKVEPTPVEIEEKPEVENKPTKQVNYDKYPKCMLCKQPIIANGCTAQLTAFTGRAYWWRSIPDTIRMCSDCSKEFSEVVEKWLVKKGVPQRLGFNEEEYL